MVFTSILFSVIFALLFSAILVYGFSRRTAGPFNGMLFLFLIIFMFTWGLGSWMTPIEPLYGEVSWLSYLLTAIVIMLLIGALLPPARTPRRGTPAEKLAREEQDNASRAVGITFGFFFWFMVIALLVIAIARILTPDITMM